MPASKGNASFQSCSDCPIKYRAVCSKCDAQELGTLETIKYYRSYDAGQPILFAGDPSQFVASVISGVATMQQTLSDGRVQMVGLLLPSDFIGRPGRDTVIYDVTAMSEVTLCCFRRKLFEQLIDSTPHIGQRLLEMSLDELDVAREWMMLLGRKTAREKITSLLALIARRSAALQLGPVTDGMRFELPISRETMANYLGLTIETVSRQISALRREGLIELEGNRQVILPDVAALSLETGDDPEAFASV